MRIRAAGIGSVKTFEGFDFDAQLSVRLQIVALAYGAPWAAGRDVVLLRPTRTGRPTWPPPLEVQAAQAGLGVLLATATD